VVSRVQQLGGPQHEGREVIIESSFDPRNQLGIADSFFLRSNRRTRWMRRQ